MFVLLFGIGYAYLTTNLSIDGTSHVKSARWDVHFDNVQINTYSVTATTNPTINNNTTIGFAVTLNNPGDIYEFTVDIVNAGTLDAKLDGITIEPELTSEQRNYFKYTVVYSDGSEISVGDPLDSGGTENIKIRVKYLEQADSSLYPSEDDNLDFSVTMNYSQGKGTPKNYAYVVSDTQMNIGSALPAAVNARNTPSLAMADWATVTGVTGETDPFYLRHLLKNNLIDKTYIGFEITDSFANNNPGVNAGIYYLGWTNDSSSINDVLEDNKQVLIDAFGSSNCIINDSNITCTASSLVGYSDNSMNVRVYNSSTGRRCYIRYSSVSKCLIFT